jgi:sigma-B regulation protein RsbU (phosphoserine phosphatase)
VRILLIDSRQAAGDSLDDGLTRLGHQVATAQVPVRADAVLAAQPFDVALLVLAGDVEPGLELLAQLKADAATAPPVVVLAGDDRAMAAMTRALQFGADDYVLSAEPTLLEHRLGEVAERLMLRVVAENNQRRVMQLSRDLREVILPLGISLSTEKNTDRLLEKILLEAKAMCRADAGTLYVRTRDDRLQFSIMLTDSLGVALGGTTGTEIPFPPLRLLDPETGAPNHRNIATYAALQGQSVNIGDIYTTKEFDFTATRAFDARNNYRSISTLTVPLKDNTGAVIAVLQLLNATDPANGETIPFNSYHQLVVESLASQAAVVFNNQLLLQRQEALLKFEHDLQIGRQIQAGFLPERLPSPPGWEIAARFMPAREVAGDFYDAFMLGADSMGFVVADVCDKGVGAALFMALVRSLVRVYTQQRYAALSAQSARLAEDSIGMGSEDGPGQDVTGAALREALILANDYIGENHLSMNMFATMFAGAVNVRTGALQWVNAGHNAPMQLSVSGEVTRMPSKSPAIGMFPGFAFEAKQGQLEPGDLLVVFSDGIPDARNPHGESFKETRLLERVKEAGGATADQFVADIQERLVTHISTAAQFDDITVMALRRL